MPGRRRGRPPAAFGLGPARSAGLDGAESPPGEVLSRSKARPYHGCRIGRCRAPARVDFRPISGGPEPRATDPLELSRRQGFSPAALGRSRTVCVELSIAHRRQGPFLAALGLRNADCCLGAGLKWGSRARRCRFPAGADARPRRGGAESGVLQPPALTAKANPRPLRGGGESGRRTRRR